MTIDETNCERCGARIRLAPRRREDSKPFRRAKVAQGVCPDCVMTQFLYNTYPLNMQIDEAGPKLLLNPLVPQAFQMSGLLARCEMSIEEVNWQRVVDNWSLPVKILKDKRNPYRRRGARLPLGLFVSEAEHDAELRNAVAGLIGEMRGSPVAPEDIITELTSGGVVVRTKKASPISTSGNSVPPDPGSVIPSNEGTGPHRGSQNP